MEQYAVLYWQNTELVVPSDVPHPQYIHTSHAHAQKPVTIYTAIKFHRSFHHRHASQVFWFFNEKFGFPVNLHILSKFNQNQSQDTGARQRQSNTVTKIHMKTAVQSCVVDSEKIISSRRRTKINCWLHTPQCIHNIPSCASWQHSDVDRSLLHCTTDSY